ncbi:MAG: ATP-binding protein [Bacilli bacterium]|nr:ATP-binding protein [Bacilli bacterium]
MFGKIIEMENNIVVLENLEVAPTANYINYHVVFNEENRKVIGEIISIKEKEIKVLLVGEVKDDIFYSGVLKKPNFTTKARLIYKSEVELFLGNQDISNKNNLYIGKSNTYEGFKVCADLNDFFANHFAIIGNTGSGKSCGVAKIIQNLFYHNDTSLPANAHIVLFDVYGEYNTAFQNLNKIPGMGYKNFTTKLDFSEGDVLNIPAYFLEVDDLALLLGATTSAELPIIEKAIKLVYIFNSQDEVMQSYKNDIIASSLLDILSSGNNPVQIRDQIVAVLTYYNTTTLNLDTIIVQPGYSRTIKQCLNIDQQGKMNSVSFVVDFLSKFKKLDLSTVNTESSLVYDLDDLYYAFEFALISEGALKSEKVYEELNQLKIRLQQIINSPNKVFFSGTEERISKEKYISDLFSSESGKRQIINMNLNYIDERFAKKLTKIYTKMFFDFTTSLEPRASFPIHIILEEAHRYVQNDNDIEVLGYNIFDRITKEGRKYGVLLGLITQRPSELSHTALSQCSNFISFRMFHPEDLKIISNISSNVSSETVEQLKSLTPGTAMVFGVSFKLPLLTKLELPNPMPQSTSVDIKNTWFN